MKGNYTNYYLASKLEKPILVNNLNKIYMKKLLFLLPILIFSIITACSDKKSSEEKQFDVDIDLIEKYLADSSITAQSTSDGIYYVIKEEGTGKRPDVFSSISIDYKGSLLNGTVFEKSNTSGNLYTFIKGWRLGIPLFREGGKGTLFIPSKFGYGVRSKRKIPANSVLIFEITLKEVILQNPNDI